MTRPAPDWFATHPGTVYDPPKRHGRRRLALATVVSLVGHALIFLAVLWAPRPRLEPVVSNAVDVALIAAPAPAPAKAAQPKAAKAKAAKPKLVQVKTPLRKTVREPRPVPSPIAAARPAAPAPVVEELSDSQVALAATAGSGSGLSAGGRACNMLQWLQNELRKDPEVHAAVAAAHRGRPAVVWNGAWVRSPGEDGEGLAIVRQAMMVHIAFAPPACRDAPVRGLVVISLNDTPGAPKVALGAGAWRWSDLLGVR